MKKEDAYDRAFDKKPPPARLAAPPPAKVRLAHGPSLNLCRLAAAVALMVMLIGCGKTAIAKTYEQSEQDGILSTYYEMDNGTWQCGGTSYPFRLELSGRMPNAESDSYYVVLTDNENLTFEDVSKSLYSSFLEDSRRMEGSVLVEMK